ncbi:MAG TPA: hypothetical protein VLD57_03925 [Blastocatellia bacterium]|nr:hypothetical protein [Blastocatellia bacterium]
MTHAEMTALLPPGPSLTAALQDQLDAPCVEPLFTAFVQPVGLMVESAVPLPDRSPPAAVFSVLRI